MNCGLLPQTTLSCAANSLTLITCSVSQAELGDIVYVELPDVGKQLTKGETFGVVESVKVRVKGPTYAHTQILRVFRKSGGWRTPGLGVLIHLANSS
jgi:hypothetical protein